MILRYPSQLTYTPKRIISLVPSQTELLYSLGLQEEVAGITKFCVHPEKWYRNKIRVGGTKNIDIQKIISLNPDLVVANKEENIKEQVEQIAEKFNVWVTDVNNLLSSINMIESIGLITNKIKESAAIISEIKFQFRGLENFPKVPAAYLIWKDPFMTTGGDTFISDMMDKAGFENVFGNRKRYPEISLEDIRNSHAKVVLLSSEPYPFREQHISELQHQLPGILVKLADGEMFSWYGSRLLHAPGYFKKLRAEICEKI